MENGKSPHFGRFRGPTFILEVFVRLVLLVSAMALGSVLPAFAQNTPAVDVAGGYSLLRDQEAEVNMHGWLASVGINLNSSIGLVGEISRNTKTYDASGIDFLEVRANTFMGGLRFASYASPAIAPFAQVLFGATKLEGSLLGVSEEVTEFSVQPGVGLDLRIQRTVAIRLGGDYRYIAIEGDARNQFRFYTALVISAGSR
jgi:hypothetical protein